MNIDALLTPTDSSSRGGSSSASNSPSKTQPARVAGGVRTSSALSQEITQSPTNPHSNPTSSPTPPYASPGRSGPTFASHTLVASTPNFRPLQQLPTSNPSPTQPASVQRPVVVGRPFSTPQTGTLANLASVQRHQTRASSVDNLLPAAVVEGHRAASFSKPVTQRSTFFRRNTRQSITDIMADVPAQTPPPRDLESNALCESETKQVSDLLHYLAENSYAYESHVQLIGLLHKGFQTHAHAHARDGDQASQDPASYSLLSELRQAREAMDTRFAVGEDLFVDWLSDEMLLATSSEERISVTELCQRAVQDEPASVRIWQMYVDWVSTNYAACNEIEGAAQGNWTQEDKEMCKELFTRDMLVNVIEQATAATQWRIDEGHLLWNRHSQLVQEDFPANPTAANIERLRNMFIQRLQVPHAEWDQTAQIFWPIVSTYEANNWEAIMAEVNELAEPGKRQMRLRETHEFNLRKAVEMQDREAEFNGLSQYLQWEKKQKQKQKKPLAFAYELRCALYERALLRFPTSMDWWMDYIDFVTSSSTSTSVLPLIERATRHCPWSGDLWSRRILRSDVEGKSRHEIEEAKHRATNSSLLDVGGMEELLKVLQQWCSYLRRHAFSTVNNEDDLDTAEVGIAMALEDIQQAGRKLCGKEFKGDTLYRLETIQIKFLTEARRLSDAREIWKKLVPAQKNSYDFWWKYYNWELWLWGYDRMTEPHRLENDATGPHLPSAVAQEALSQRHLDWPEKVLDMYLNHFQQHESGDKLQHALVDAREFSKHLAIRKAKEAEQAQQLAAYQQAAIVDRLTGEASVALGSEKRKREEGEIPNGHSDKKLRTESAAISAEGFGEPSSSASARVKRDRENNTITVRNLPMHVSEIDIKKFFRDVGTPLSMSIIEEKSGDTKTATVEFETHEDVLAAKTRNGKKLNGNETRIQSGTQSTLYVTNYPSEYDEAAMRKLFEDYGEIVSVRFPSLKFNDRRRFCYVQFLTSEMAKAAEAAMDNKMLDGQHKLLAKISDPDAKKQRSGAQAEGREICVRNIERNAPEEEIKQFFESYGNVVSINLVKLVTGKKTGTGFFVFSSADEAAAALAANNKPFHDRILHVELASSKGRTAPLDRAKKQDVVIKQISSGSPEAEGRNERRGSDLSMTSSAQAVDDSWKTVKARKIAIFNLPDTVNHTRVRAAMEIHGSLVKIQMRKEDHGAIVEFANTQDAFNVRQGVDCSALGPDVKTGDVADLLSKGTRRHGNHSGGVSSTHPTAFMRPAALSRPGGERGGRRGGLGFKRGGTTGTGRSAEDADNAAMGNGVGVSKSNADFRAMLEKSGGAGSAIKENE